MTLRRKLHGYFWEIIKQILILDLKIAIVYGASAYLIQAKKHLTRAQNMTNHE